MKTRRRRGGFPPLNLSMMRKTAIHHISFASSVAVYCPEQLAAWVGAEGGRLRQMKISEQVLRNGVLVSCKYGWQGEGKRITEVKKGESCKEIDYRGVLARVMVSRQCREVLSHAAEALMEVERKK